MKLGIFGGAFDPVHLGHTILAEKIFVKFALNKLIFVPSQIPPHKSFHTASGADRFAMLRIAVSELGEGYKVSDFELNSKSVSYTYDTLKYFQENNEGDDIFFVAGSDIFSTIKSWKNWSELFSLTKFIVVSRSGVSFNTMFERIGDDLSSSAVTSDDYLAGKDGKIILFETDIPEISSTYIRKNIFNAEGLVMGSVLSYIREHKLYKEGR